MKHLTTLFASIVALSVALGGCNKDSTATPESGEAEPKAEVKTGETTPKAAAPEPSEVSIDQLASLIEAKKVAIFDANREAVRQKYGKIPGARLLSGYDWNLEELPADRSEKLVFYCSNSRCGSAPNAAKKAIVAGYSDVSVLRAGIMGWTEAGQETETVQ